MAGEVAHDDSIFFFQKTEIRSLDGKLRWNIF